MIKIVIGILNDKVNFLMSRYFKYKKLFAAKSGRVIVLQILWMYLVVSFL